MQGRIGPRLRAVATYSRLAHWHPHVPSPSLSPLAYHSLLLQRRWTATSTNSTAPALCDGTSPLISSPPSTDVNNLRASSASPPSSSSVVISSSEFGSRPAHPTAMMSPAFPRAVQLQPSRRQQQQLALVQRRAFSMKQLHPKNIWAEIKHGVQYTVDGMKKFWSDMKVAKGLLKRIARGEELDRKERRTLNQAVADMFRIVPFSIFVIVPFLELTLPFFLWLFPNMLPSSFQDQSKESAKKIRELQARVQYAKFLQDTVAEMAVDLKKKTSSQELQSTLLELEKFLKKLKAGEITQITEEEIIKFRKLFANELPLTTMSRHQLQELCKFMGIPHFAPDPVLRLHLRMKMRQIRKDDMELYAIGVHRLPVEELVLSCRARGIRTDRGEITAEDTKIDPQLEQWLRQQLSMWIHLSLRENLSNSLLIMLQAFNTTQVSAVVQEAQKNIEASQVSEIDRQREEQLRKEEMEELERIEKKKQKEQTEGAAAAAAAMERIAIAKAVAAAQAQAEAKQAELQAKLESERKRAQLLEDKLKENFMEVFEDLEEVKEDIQETAVYLKELAEKGAAGKQPPERLRKSAELLQKQVTRLTDSLKNKVATDKDKQMLESLKKEVKAEPGSIQESQQVLENAPALLAAAAATAKKNKELKEKAAAAATASGSQQPAQTPATTTSPATKAEDKKATAKKESKKPAETAEPTVQPDFVLPTRAVNNPIVGNITPERELVAEVRPQVNQDSDPMMFSHTAPPSPRMPKFLERAATRDEPHDTPSTPASSTSTPNTEAPSQEQPNATPTSAESDASPPPSPLPQQNEVGAKKEASASN